MNFFLTNFLISGKGIASYGSSLMVASDNFFAKENALFGLTCLDMYKFDGNNTYLTNAKYIWNYLKGNFWDIKFGGVFIGINEAGDPTITGRSIEDQIFYALLSLRIASIETTNNSYISDYLTLSTLINKNFVKNNLVASSTDLYFNPSSEALWSTYHIFPQSLDQLVS